MFFDETGGKILCFLTAHTSGNIWPQESCAGMDTGVRCPSDMESRSRQRWFITFIQWMSTRNTHIARGIWLHWAEPSTTRCMTEQPGRWQRKGCRSCGEPGFPGNGGKLFDPPTSLRALSWDRRCPCAAFPILREIPSLRGIKWPKQSGKIELSNN